LHRHLQLQLHVLVDVVPAAADDDDPATQQLVDCKPGTTVLMPVVQKVEHH
jgi:hypothetical protein